MSVDETLQDDLKRRSLIHFWAAKQEEYLELSRKAVNFILPFATTHCLLWVRIVKKYEKPWSTTTTEDIISAARLMREIDKRVSYQQFLTSLDLNMSQVHKILHEHLTVRKPHI
ncbi:hypothetical protein EVAR_908_1 [Eumeta japonica]|uniref:Uncharacterized protein n=1 Tax=Eumeta variegata TaxID=151549 RepID=A0A4C1SG22_EUMVA|nr:hypothetical protein EVAR_908_1 [Eumeta japonica]